MKSGKDDNRSSTTLGIHKSRMLPPNKKKNKKFMSDEP
jgi:hypothetical protein